MYDNPKRQWGGGGGADVFGEMWLFCLLYKLLYLFAFLPGESLTKTVLRVDSASARVDSASGKPTEEFFAATR